MSKKKPAAPAMETPPTSMPLPEVIDEAAQQAVCTILTLGCSRKTAAEYLGCSVDALRNTARRSPQFAVQMNKAEATCEVTALSRLNQTAKEPRNWRIVVWLLERRYPHRFGLRKPGAASPQEMTGIAERLMDVLVAEVRDADDRRRIRRRLQSVLRRLQPPAENYELL